MCRYQISGYGDAGNGHARSVRDRKPVGKRRSAERDCEAAGFDCDRERFASHRFRRRWWSGSGRGRLRGLHLGTDYARPFDHGAILAGDVTAQEEKRRSAKTEQGKRNPDPLPQCAEPPRRLLGNGEGRRSLGVDRWWTVDCLHNRRGDRARRGRRTGRRLGNGGRGGRGCRACAGCGRRRRLRRACGRRGSWPCRCGRRRRGRACSSGHRTGARRHGTRWRFAFRDRTLWRGSIAGRKLEVAYCRACRHRDGRSGKQDRTMPKAVMWLRTSLHGPRFVNACLSLPAGSAGGAE